MRFHWSNENERPRGADGKRPKGLPYHGRAWLHRDGQPSPYGVEWNLWSHFAHAYVQTDHGDGDVTIAVALPPVALWLSIPVRRVMPRREIGVHFHNGTLHWHMWADPHSWSSGTPRWRDGHLNLLDLVLGEPRYEERELERRDVGVPMPERTYRATARRYEATWSRPRWWPKRITRVHIEMAEGEQIPVPGKGENSWDCGDDAIFSSGGGPARTISDAIGSLIASALQTRERRGGSEWSPVPKQPQVSNEQVDA